jgi:hypothetical protein
VRFILWTYLCFIIAVATAIGTPAQTHKTIPLSDAIDRALSKSQLTLPGGEPFHIRFSIVETTNTQSERHAEVEEYWLSTEKYRRTIVSPAFSQTLIVNGAAVSETNTGDYYPYWLYELLTAVFDPIPFAAQLKQVKQEIADPGGATNQVCSDLQMRVDRVMVCFERNGLLASVFTKGYDAYYKEYKKFGAKQVARRVIHDPESKNEIVAVIDTLESVTQPDEAMFAVATPTPPAERIQVLRIDEEAMRGLVIGGAQIDWPTVVGGKDSGGCGAFISADRAGNVREAFSEGCDNTGLEEPLRQILLKWKLNQPVVNGAPVQVTALMGFPFKVQVEPAPPVPELSNAEARKLAKNKVDPVFPLHAKPGTKFEIPVSVDDDGKVLGCENPKGLSGDLFLPACSAVTHWKFSPYVKDGKPVPFKATVIFVVP